MQVARRVYIYLMCYIGLLMVLFGASNLLRLFIERLSGTSQEDFGLSGYWRNQFSIWGAVLIVGTVVWAIHWFLARRSVAPSNPDADNERRSVLRKLFIYGVLAVTLVQVALQAERILMALLRPMQMQTSGYYDLDLGMVLRSAFPDLFVYSIVGLYYWYVRRQDNSATPEEGRPATVRRWYFYLACYVALSIVMAQIAALVRYVWEFATDPYHPWSPDTQWIPPAVASALAWILVAGAVWFFHWTATQRHMLTWEEERHAPLRKVYLYGMTLQTVGVTLGNLTYLLITLMRSMWGTDPTADIGGSLLTLAGGPVASMLVYGAFWAYHWQVIRWDSSLVASEVSAKSSIRQLYYYLVALLGLGMLVTGVVSLIQRLIEELLGGSGIIARSAQAWGDQISFVVAMILIGGAVWLYNWLIVQREAMSSTGQAARNSLPRRLYLTLIILVTVLSLIGSVGTLLFQALLHVGETAGFSIFDISWPLAVTITAGTLLAYHLYILVGDQRAHAAFVVALPALTLPEPEPEPAAILLLRGGDPARIETSIAAFQAQLPDNIRTDIFPVAGVTPAEIRAWLASRATSAAPGLPPAPQTGQPTSTTQPAPA